MMRWGGGGPNYWINCRRGPEYGGEVRIIYIHYILGKNRDRCVGCGAVDGWVGGGWVTVVELMSPHCGGAEVGLQPRGSAVRSR